MSTILTLTELQEPHPDAVAYVVWQNKDYIISLAALVKLVTAASLNLDKVDNTADLEKPLSKVMQEALLLKADKDSVPTNAEFKALADSLQNYVTKDQLDAAVTGLHDLIVQLPTKSELQAAIQGVTDLLESGLNQLRQELQQQAVALQALTVKVDAAATQDELNQAIQSLEMTFNQALQALSQSLGGRVQTLEDGLGQTNIKLQQLAKAQAEFNRLLADKADKVHTHDATEITGLAEFVDERIGSIDKITLGPNEW